MSELQLPKKPGVYLFYVEKDGSAYYLVDELHFDNYGDPYTELGYVHDVVAWWHLPKPNEFPTKGESSNE